MTTDSTAGNEQPEMQGVAGATDDGRVYVVTPQAMAVEGPPRDGVETDEEPKALRTRLRQLVSDVRDLELKRILRVLETLIH